MRRSGWWPSWNGSSRIETSGSPRVALLVILGLVLWLGLSVFDPVCAIDEPAWISSASVTNHLIRTLAPPAEWSDAYDRLQLGDWGHRNPPIGKVVIGAGLALAGESDLPRFMWPTALPPMRDLIAARLAIVAVSGLTLWLAYWFAWQLTQSAFAVGAPLFLFALPVFRFHATHVYTDMPQLALLLAGAILLTSGRFLWASGAIGLACAVKFNAAPELGAVVIIAIWARRWRTALLVPIVAFAAFVAVNPYLYPHPIGRSLSLVQEWRAQKQAQRTDAIARPWVIASRAEALARTMAAVFRPDRVQAGVFGDSTIGWLLMVLLMLGLTQLRAPIWWSLFTASFLSTVLWLPFDWGRYYLPVIVWLPPVAVIGCELCVTIVWRSYSKLSWWLGSDWRSGRSI